jgi:hypothetical protein
VRLLLIFLIFALYTIGCVYFAIQAAGAGHGTFIFFAPVVTWPLLLVVAVLIGLRTRPMVCATLLITHSVISIGLIIGYISDGPDAFLRMWAQSRQLMIVGICWYVFGQMGFWLGFLTSARAAAREARLP